MPGKRGLSPEEQRVILCGVTRRIKRIAPLQAGKMLGVLYGCLGLIFLPFFAFAGLAGAFAQQTQQTQNAGGPPTAVIARMMFGFCLFLALFYCAHGLKLRDHSPTTLQS